MSITYTDQLASLHATQLGGFFVGWPSQPSSEKHLQILQNSYAAWVAMDGERCVGFINALSDGVFYAYIPLLEVLPTHQRQGIGKELVRRMLESLGNMYAVDLMCDPELQGFYEASGFQTRLGMIRRNYQRQDAKG